MRLRKERMVLLLLEPKWEDGGGRKGPGWEGKIRLSRRG
jgi:hypothetical protein